MPLSLVPCFSVFLCLAAISVVVCDVNKKVKNLLGRIKETPGLKTIVVMEEIDGESRSMADSVGIRLLQYSELERLGRENPTKINVSLFMNTGNES
jgi:hypothetical protein